MQYSTSTPPPGTVIGDIIRIILNKAVDNLDVSVVDHNDWVQVCIHPWEMMGKSVVLNVRESYIELRSGFLPMCDASMRTLNLADPDIVSKLRATLLQVLIDSTNQK